MLIAWIMKKNKRKKTVAVTETNLNKAKFEEVLNQANIKFDGIDSIKGYNSELAQLYIKECCPSIDL